MDDPSLLIAVKFAGFFLAVMGVVFYVALFWLVVFNLPRWHRERMAVLQRISDSTGRTADGTADAHAAQLEANEQRTAQIVGIGNKVDRLAAAIADLVKSRV